MKLKFTLITILSFLKFLICFSQSGQAFENVLVELRNQVVGIGFVAEDTININGKKVFQKKFVGIGSGLATYVNYDSIALRNIVTAGHVMKFFIEHNYKSIFIRPSWADTLKTTEYFGIEIPVKNSDGFSNIFLYPDSRIDLACLIMPYGYFDSFAFSKTLASGNKIFPYNDMTTPYLGDQVWIMGYPSHVETEFAGHFLYYITTVKPGYIAWKAESSFNNPDLNHITIVESNATFGNSGGPVFSRDQARMQLVGIMVGGYKEIDSVYTNGKPLVDYLTKKPVISVGRSGVSIIEKAEFVKRLVQYVQKQLDDYIKKSKS